MAVECFYCDFSAPDYQTLATHVSGSKKGHRRGKRWAAKYLMVNGLSFDKRHELPKRVANNPDKEKTAFGDENRANSKRVLSGKTEFARVFCPWCKKHNQRELPVEYTGSQFAWHREQCLVVCCEGCAR